MTEPGPERMPVKDALEAALEARRELGAELEPQIVESFVDSVGREIDARVDSRLAQKAGESSRDAGDVAIWTVGLGIPLTGAAGGDRRSRGDHDRLDRDRACEPRVRRRTPAPVVSAA